MAPGKITINPVPLQEHIDKLVEFAEANAPHLQESVKLVKQHFVDAGNLVRITTFAGVYGTLKHNRMVARQSIYNMVNNGKITEIVIDDVKFIDQTAIPE